MGWPGAFALPIIKKCSNLQPCAHFTCKWAYHWLHYVLLTHWLNYVWFFFIWTFKQIWLRCHFMITRKTASADESHVMWSKAPEQLLKRLLINKFFRNCSFFPFLFSYRSPFLHVLHIIILTKAGTGNKRQMSLIKCTEAYEANTMCCWEKTKDASKKSSHN